MGGRMVLNHVLWPLQYLRSQRTWFSHMNQTHPDKNIPDAAWTVLHLPLLCVSGRQTGGGQDPQQPAISCDEHGVSPRSSWYEMSFSSTSCPNLGTGMRQEVFHSTGTFSTWRLILKSLWKGTACWPAQSLRSLGQTPSGPAAILDWCLLSSAPTSSIVTEGAAQVVAEGCQQEWCWYQSHTYYIYNIWLTHLDSNAG